MQTTWDVCQKMEGCEWELVPGEGENEVLFCLIVMLMQWTFQSPAPNTSKNRQSLQKSHLLLAPCYYPTIYM